jgi:hypothetical protein
VEEANLRVQKITDPDNIHRRANIQANTLLHLVNTRHHHKDLGQDNLTVNQQRHLMAHHHTVHHTDHQQQDEE